MKSGHFHFYELYVFLSCSVSLFLSLSLSACEGQPRSSRQVAVEIHTTAVLEISWHVEPVVSVSRPTSLILLKTLAKRLHHPRNFGHFPRFHQLTKAILSTTLSQRCFPFVFVFPHHSDHVPPISLTSNFFTTPWAPRATDSVL